ncbi:Breast cancer type 2 susceptibility [Nymphon striatum]|nr:Breast cancer type 2 susceptibility [Nymphon striatum]
MILIVSPVISAPSNFFSDRMQSLKSVTATPDINFTLNPMRRLFYSHKSKCNRNTPQFNSDNCQKVVENDKVTHHENEINSNNQRALCHMPFLGNQKPNLELCEEKTHHEKKNNFQTARDVQNSRIKTISENKIHPKPGKICQRNIESKSSLWTAVQGKSPSSVLVDEIHKYNIKPSTLNVTSGNSLEFCFTWEDFSKDCISDYDGAFFIGDSAMLVLSDDGLAGKDEFYRAFLTMEGVNKNLFSREWLENHYKWIIWKLASTELKFPFEFGGKYFNPDTVMFQLKYRYDREIDSCHRSSLKKIMERDDVPNRTLVLCVSKIIDNSTLDTQEQSENDSFLPQFSIEATDGWYSIPVMIDDFLSNLIQKHKLCVGQKIITHGAELVGFDAACSPLEAPPGLKLKISTNSTRRARWDIKLGFQLNPSPFAIPLCSVIQGGGTIACVHIVIQRVYPIVYMEKFPDGSTVIRTKKAEDEVNRKHESMKQEYLEKIMNKIENEHRMAKRKDVKTKDKSTSFMKETKIQALQTQEELHDAYEASADPESFLRLLNEEQIKLLHDHQCACHEEELAEFQSKVTDALQNEEQHDIEVIDYNVLSIWNPSSDLESLLLEGKSFKCFYIKPSKKNFKKKSKDEGIGLVAHKMTRYQNLKISSELESSMCQQRYVSAINQLRDNSCKIPYEEVDMVFVIVDIVTTSVVSQTIYVCDEHLSVAALKFPGGPKICGAENMMVPRTVICVMNLHLEPYTMHNGQVPCLLASDMSSFSTNPRLKQHQEAFTKLSAICEKEDIAGKCQEKWTDKIQITKSSFSSPQCFKRSEALRGRALSVDTALQKRMNRLRQYGHSPKLPPINSPNLKSAQRRFKPPTFILPPRLNDSLAMERNSNDIAKASDKDTSLPLK